jgi:hypothetical protein
MRYDGLASSTPGLVPTRLQGPGLADDSQWPRYRSGRHRARRVERNRGLRAVCSLGVRPGAAVGLPCLCRSYGWLLKNMVRNRCGAGTCFSGCGPDRPHRRGNFRGLTVEVRGAGALSGARQRRPPPKVLIRSDSSGATYGFAAACRTVGGVSPGGGDRCAGPRRGRGAQHRRRLVSGRRFQRRHPRRHLGSPDPPNWWTCRNGRPVPG